MSNSLTALNPEYWSRSIQDYRYKMLVAKEITNLSLSEYFGVGDTVNSQYLSDMRVQDYTKYTDTTAQDVDATNETLSIDQSKIITISYDKVDRKQNIPGWVDLVTKRAAHLLSNEMDGKLLAEVDNAVLDIDDGDIGGTSGNPIDLSSSNVVKTFARTMAELQANNVEEDRGMFVVIDPVTASKILEGNVANGFNMADSNLRNGLVGRNYVGFDVYISNNLRSSQVLTYTNVPSNGDTIKIQPKGGDEITVTFVTAAAAAAGEVQIAAGDADETYERFTNLINGTTDANVVAFSDSDKNALSYARVVATQTAASDIVTITSSGELVVTDDADNVTKGDQTLHCLAGQKGAIDMAMQISPNVEVHQEPLKLVDNYLVHTLYGVKTFSYGTERILDLQLKRS